MWHVDFRCQWHGRNCNITKDFKTTLTDLGVCYTFNYDYPPLSVKEPGDKSFGLLNFNYNATLSSMNYLCEVTMKIWSTRARFKARFLIGWRDFQKLKYVNKINFRCFILSHFLVSLRIWVNNYHFLPKLLLFQDQTMHWHFNLMWNNMKLWEVHSLTLV